jgi:hypothetical protein
MKSAAAVGLALALAGLAPLGSGTAEAAYVRRVVVRTPVLRVHVGTVVTERRGYGRLHVEVDPERARVYIDGRYQGRGDLTRSLRAGRHTVRVVLNDGRRAAETVWVDHGRLTVARLDLD